MKDWKQELDSFFDAQEKKQMQDDTQRAGHEAEAAQFITGVVEPAFGEVKAELEKRGRTVTVSSDARYMYRASISVEYEGREELDYTIEVRVNSRGAFATPVIRFTEKGQRYKGEGFFRSGAQDYTASDITKDEVIANVIHEYKMHATARKE